MPGKVMDGRAVAEKIRSRIKVRVIDLTASNVRPNLVNIVVGDNPASRSYLERQRAACIDVGIRSRNIELPATIAPRELKDLIRKLNGDKSVTGILLELPLSKSLDEVATVSNIAPAKDVDGVHPYNLGLLMQKRGDLVPCTPKGVLVLLKHFGVNLAGSQVVIINRSRIVGRPLSQLLLNEDATVTVCHSKTQDLQEICRDADILITGIGHRSEFTVGPDMIKPGATVVDVGTSVVGDEIVGDVDFDAVIKIAGYVTPVPGGVGPMTVAMLLYNTILAACLQRGIDVGFTPNELKATERS